MRFRLTSAAGSLPRKPTGTILTSKTKTPPVTPAKIGATRLSTNFPSPFSKVIAAGAGRYLCLQIPDGEKIAIFDVSLLKVVGYIPVFGTDFAFCAGKEKLFVFDNASQNSFPAGILRTANWKPRARLKATKRSWRQSWGQVDLDLYMFFEKKVINFRGRCTTPNLMWKALRLRNRVCMGDIRSAGRLVTCHSSGHQPSVPMF